MALSAKLQLRQTQSLVITPQLMQAIRLLQMSGLELERFVAGELEQNPLLESADDAPSATEAAESDESPSDAAADAVGEDIDAEPADVFPEDAGPPPGQGPAFSAARRSPAAAGFDDLGLDQTPAATESLEALLSRTIDAVFTEAPADRAIALALLAGARRGRLPDRRSRRRGASASASRRTRSERVLRICQDLAPTGTFARSLAECLELQLVEREPAFAGDADAARQPRPACGRRPRRPRGALRCRARRHRHARRRASRARSEARPCLRARAGAHAGPRRLRALRAVGRLDRGAERRGAAAASRQPHLLRRGRRQASQATPRRSISPTACRRRAGWRRASTSARARC